MTLETLLLLLYPSKQLWIACPFIQDVCLENNNKGYYYVTVYPPNVPVPTPVPTRRDSCVRSLAK